MKASLVGLVLAASLPIGRCAFDSAAPCMNLLLSHPVYP